MVELRQTFNPPQGKIYPRTGKLIALYSIYNEEDLIKESMRSVYSICDEIWALDGKYSGFICPCGNQQHEGSCDSTQEKIDEFVSETGAKVVRKTLPEMPELQKRQTYFDDMRVGDTGLVFDGDEFFYGDRRELLTFACKLTLNETLSLGWLEKKAGYVDEFMSLGPGIQNFIRVHVKTPNLHYVPSGQLGYTFQDDEGIYQPSQVYPMKNARLLMIMGSGQRNIPGARNKARERAKMDYDEAIYKGKIIL